MAELYGNRRKNLGKNDYGNLGKNLGKNCWGNLGKIYYGNLGKNLGNNYFNLTLTLLFHRSYSTNSVKPKPGAYTACGQNERNYFI